LIVSSKLGAEIVKLMAVIPDPRTAARASALGDATMSLNGAHNESMTNALAYTSPSVGGGSVVAPRNARESERGANSAATDAFRIDELKSRRCTI
jgi:hypothetical protein